MSLTGSGFDSSLSGGSFFGKKNSSSSRKRDLYKGSSNCLSVMSRFSSGWLPGPFGLIDSDPIIPAGYEHYRCRRFSLNTPKPSLYTDERHSPQVAPISARFYKSVPSAHAEGQPCCLVRL